ncbi:MAG: hypothetical protein FWF81_12100, partial [Defluviitaleaceae bacterium]|nr:hypothetical protein [Defluviitaleaceae bacterium]
MISINLKKTVALLLVLMISMQSVVIAEPGWEHEINTHEYWHEIDPLDLYLPLEDFPAENYFEILMRRLQEQDFNTLTAEEQMLLINYKSASSNLPPSPFAAFGDDISTNNDAVELALLLSRVRIYSELTENERMFIYSQLGITFEFFEIARDLFLEMERLDFSLTESVSRIENEREQGFALGSVLWADLHLIANLENGNIQTTTIPALDLNTDYPEFETEQPTDSLFAPMTATHSGIVENPFRLNFSAEESVLLNSGAVVYRQNILSLPGRGGFGLNLDLVYNSFQSWAASSRIPNSVAFGWSFDLPYIFNNTLHVPGRGTFRIQGNNILGNLTTDMQLESTGFFFPSGELRADRVLRFYNGTRYYFSGGFVIGMVDRFGNTIRFEYGAVETATGLRPLNRIIDSNGKIIQLNYRVSGANHLITVTTPDNGVFTITRTRIEGLLAHNFRLESTTNQAGAVTRFQHENKRLLRNVPNDIIDRAMILVGVIYPSRAELRFTYRINFDSTNMHEIWQITSRFLRCGNSPDKTYLFTQFSYGFTVLCNIAGFTPARTVTQNNGLRTEFLFNDSRLNIRQTVYLQDGELRNIKSIKHITYDNRNLPSSIELTERRGNFSRTSRQSFTYNSVGQMTESISPLAQGSTHARYRTRFTYDSRFGLPLTKTYFLDVNTTIVERNILSQDGRRIIRTNIYENNVRQSHTEFFHDSYGNVTEIREFPSVSASQFISTQITFNQGTLPQSIRTTGVRNAAGALLNGNGIVERSFTYDSMWRVLSETDPNGYVTRWQYDRVGRVTRIDFPNGGFVTYAYNDTQNTLTHRTVLGAIYTYQYDGFGNLLSITVGGTAILTNIYDNRMRLIQTMNAQGIASSQRRVMTYDIFDRVTETRILDANNIILYRETIDYLDVTNDAGCSLIINIIHGESNAPSILIFALYDRFGRKTQGGISGGLYFFYSHDLAGRVVREQSLVGVDNTFTYNIFGVTSVRNIEGSIARKVYDSIGRLVRESDFMGNYTRFTYDILGRLVQRETPFERVGNTTHYARTQYNYNLNGNVISIATLISQPGTPDAWSRTLNTFRHNMLTSSETGGASGVKTYFTYDLAGNILTQRVGDATTTFTYNNRGQLTRTTDALNQLETFTYDANGLLLTKTDRTHTVFRMTYDGMGRLVRNEAMRWNTLIDFMEYTYSLTGLVTQERRGMYAINIGYIPDTGHIINNFFDAQGRLIRQEETGGIVKTFQYNAANSRLQSSVYLNQVRQTRNDYTYDVAQRLHTVSVSGSRIATYTYDANGRLATATMGNGVLSQYTRNLAGLITNLTHQHGSTVLSRFTYSYLLDGNVRQRVETLGNTTRTVAYTYDLARRLTSEQVIGTGAITRTYQYDNRNNRTQMTVTGGQTYIVNYTYDLNNRLLREERTGNSPRITTYSYDRNGNQVSRVTNNQTETRTYNGFNQLVRVV